MAVTLSRRGILAGLLAVAVAAVCIRLGFWQLDRLEQRRERSAALRSALALPPLELAGDTLAAVLRDPESYRYRRVRARGAYAAQADVVVRARALEGRPGVHLVTPLRLAGQGAAVLVNRGWVASPDAATIDPRPLAEPGVQQIEGLLLPLPRGGGGRPVIREIDGTRVLSVQRLDLYDLRGGSGDRLLPVYVQLLPTAAASETPVRLPLPDLEDEGPHLAYAVQWFAFAAIAMGGFLLLVWRESRSER